MLQDGLILQTPKEKKTIYFRNKCGLFKSRGSWRIMLNFYPPTPAAPPPPLVGGEERAEAEN